MEALSLDNLPTMFVIVQACSSLPLSSYCASVRDRFAVSEAAYDLGVIFSIMLGTPPPSALLD